MCVNQQRDVWVMTRVDFSASAVPEPSWCAVSLVVKQDKSADICVRAFTYALVGARAKVEAVVGLESDPRQNRRVAHFGRNRMWTGACLKAPAFARSLRFTRCGSSPPFQNSP
ncbi:protein arrd [Echinococcus multilocularis]|uniref:Serine n=1 Tax=Echinococcus multilocularis TaxID=6211 RepID=A0A0S4MIB0_ECHMU|nr:protein arrd [Echinococcus multilocularis]